MHTHVTRTTGRYHAREWYEKAAFQGNMEAQAVYGSLLATGQGGLKENWELGLKYLQHAADKGHAKATGALKAVDWTATVAYAHRVAGTQINTGGNSHLFKKAEHLTWNGAAKHVSTAAAVQAALKTAAAIPVDGVTVSGGAADANAGLDAAAAAGGASPANDDTTAADTGAGTTPAATVAAGGE